MALNDAAGDVDTTWDAGLLTAADGSSVELRVVGHRSGGNPNSRRTVEVGAVRWVAAVQETQVVESSLYYLRARYYDPEVGRFLARDALSSAPSWAGHAYLYARANPATLLDPLGLCGWGVLGTAGASFLMSAGR